MKKSTILLSALVTCMTFAMYGAGPFTVNVILGSNSGNPSLVFGQGAATVQNAFPPFSSMFGVKDVYLANSKNFGEKAGVSGDFSRLGTDIRTNSDENKWVLMAGTDATAYFQLAEGDATLYVAATGDEEGKLLGESLSLKAGNSYTISTRPATRAVVPAEDPASQTIYLVEDEVSGLYKAEATVQNLGGTTSATLYLISGDADIYLYDGAKYYAKNGTSSKTAPEAGWVVSLTAKSITYGSDVALLTFNTAMDSLSLAVTAAKASYKPITTTVAVNNARVGAVNWIIKSNGTLDFDGDGEVTLDDANYFYNYAAGDCSEYLEAADLLMFGTKAATLEKAQAALEYFRNNFDALFFDGSEADLANVLDNANYFYNFAAGDFSEYLEAADLLMFGTKAATEEKAQTALEAMRQLMQ